MVNVLVRARASSDRSLFFPARPAEISMYKLRRIPFPIAVLCLVFFSSRAVSQQDGPSDAAEDKIRKSHLLDKALAPHPSYEALIESLVKKRQTEEYQRVLDLLKNQKMSREEAMKNPAFLRGLRDNLK